MCLLERQTPSFSPTGVWDGIQQYLSLNKQAFQADRGKACLLVFPVASLVSKRSVE